MAHRRRRRRRRRPQLATKQKQVAKKS